MSFLNINSKRNDADEVDTESYPQNNMGLYGGGYDDIYSQAESGKKYDLLKWQQDLFDEVDQLKHDLNGEVLTNEGWVQVHKPLLNDAGVQMIETAIRPLFSRNLINSNFTEERALQILKDTHNDIKDNLVYNYDKYDVEFLSYDHIVRLIKNSTISAPFRAIAGWTKKIDTSIQKRQETFVETQQQQKRGWWKK